MPYLHLHPQENVIFQGHPCWRAILGFYIKGVFFALLVGAFAKFVLSEGAIAGVLVAVLIGITLLSGFIKRWAITYTITNKRLNIKRGIISREIQETRLERVQNVQYHQTVYQRIMKIGDVEFDTAGTEDSNFFFYGVADPATVVHKVDSVTGEVAGPQGLGEAQPAAS